MWSCGFGVVLESAAKLLHASSLVLYLKPHRNTTSMPKAQWDWIRAVWSCPNSYVCCQIFTFAKLILFIEEHLCKRRNLGIQKKIFILPSILQYRCGAEAVPCQAISTWSALTRARWLSVTTLHSAPLVLTWLERREGTSWLWLSAGLIMIIWLAFFLIFFFFFSGSVMSADI